MAAGECNHLDFSAISGSHRIQPAAYHPPHVGRTSQDVAYCCVDGDASRGYITHNVGKSVSG